MTEVNNGYKDYVSNTTFIIEYDVGRGIGMVQQEFTEGSIIPAKLSNGNLLFSATYTTGGKHYVTIINLDPTLFSPADEVKVTGGSTPSLVVILITTAVLLVAIFSPNDKAR